jgi:putative transposase
VTQLCRYYRVTRAGFYASRARPVSAHATQDRCLLDEITRRFTTHGGKYGSPRIHHAMVTAGWTVSRRRVARLMREAGLRAKAVRGYRAKAGTHRFYAQHPNRLRTTHATAADQIWVGDITYLAVAGAWRYLAVVMDQYSRRVLAWTLTRQRDARVTRDVLTTAVARRRPVAGVIFHSDRGSEYLAESFGARVAELGLLQSRVRMARETTRTWSPSSTRSRPSSPAVSPLPPRMGCDAISPRTSATTMRPDSTPRSATTRRSPLNA